MSKPRRKTFLVSFCSHDYYEIELLARSEEEAIDKAEDLFDRFGEKPFTFDTSRGGTDEWQAVEVAS